MFYHWNGGNFIIMLAVRKIIVYDLDKQSIKQEYQYPSYIRRLTAPFGGFDPQKNIIYVIAWNRCVETFAFNLTTKKWTDLHFDTMPNFFFIPSPINQTHFFLEDGTQHLMKNNNYESKLLCSEIGLQHCAMPNYMEFVYNLKRKKLMLIQHRQKHILECNINDINQQTFNWTKSQIVLGWRLAHIYCDVILGWNQILFIFNWPCKIVECIDLEHPGKEPFTHSMTGIFAYAQYPNTWDIGAEFKNAVKDRDNYVHLFSFGCDTDKENLHFKINLHDMIPDEILKVNQKDHDPLVIGYCKESEKNDKSPFIPYYLKQLILQFYPIFV